MARTRAHDHGAKRAAILAAAARIFAQGGYHGTSMSALAAEMGVSKALIYHYYPGKEHILHDIIAGQLSRLADALGGVGPGEPRARLRAMVQALLAAYRDADDAHKVQIGALPLLPAPAREALGAQERALVRLMADAVAAIRPDLPPGRLTPVTMSLFGMLNWAYMWFRDDGPMSREAYGDMVTALFLTGLDGVA